MTQTHKWNTAALPSPGRRVGVVATALLALLSCVGVSAASKPDSAPGLTALKEGQADGSDARPLPSAAPQEWEIRGGEKHLYGLRFPAPQYLKLVIAQRGTDVVVSLLDAGRKETLRVDKANGTRGVETLSLVVKDDRSAYLQVTALGSNSSVGGYQLSVEELRAPDELGDKRAAAELSFYEGETLRKQVKVTTLTQAVEKYEHARRLWQEAGDGLNTARAVHGVCKSYYYMGKMQEALGRCGEALALSRATPSRWDEAVTLLTISLTNLALAQYESAWRDCQAALVIFEQEQDDKYRAFAAYTLGRINFLQGDINEALEKYREALEVRRRLGDRVGEAFTGNALGRVYFYRVGNHGEALEHYKDALRLAQELKHEELTAQVLGDIGRLYFAEGRHDLALEHYRQALDIIGGGEPRTHAEILTYTGMAYAATGRPREALEEYYVKALRLQRETRDAVGEGHTLHHMGNAHAAAGSYDEALVHLNGALKIWRSVIYRAAEADTRYDIAQAELRRGNLAEACRQLEVALPVVESLRTKIANESLRTSYFVSVQKYYELYIDALMSRFAQTGDKKFEALALGVSERRRVRSLLDTLIESQAEIRSGIPPKLREEEREIQEQLSAVSFSTMLTDALTAEQAAKVGADLDRLIRRYHDLEERVRRQSPRYAGLRYPTPPTAEQIQRELLGGDRMLLEYALGDAKSYLWAVTADGVESYVLPGRAEIEPAVDELRRLLTERNRLVAGELPAERERRFEQSDARLASASAALARVLKLDGGQSLLRAERLMIVGDGALQYLPFAALLVPERGEKQSATPAAGGQGSLVPLLAYHETEFPLAMSLAMEFKRGRVSNPQPPPPKTIAVIADPVFGTQDERCCKPRRGARGGPRRLKDSNAQAARPTTTGQAPGDSPQHAAREVGLITDSRGDIARLGLTWYEAQAILALVPQARRMAALGFDAKLDLVTAPESELSRYRILHFGTHGLLNNKRPELSGVLLSMVDEYGAPRNGFLQMHHIYNLQLRADLVVLSSCETAIGKEMRGEGLAGLSRGFIYAGARRVVASLWAVHDASTSELMTSFYKHLNIDEGSGRIGLRPSAALRRAQLEMWRQRLWRSPYFWAGFVAQGEVD